MRKGRKMVEAGFMFLKRTGVYTCGEMGNDLTAFVGTNSLPDRGFMRWRISNPYLRRFQGSAVFGEGVDIPFPLSEEIKGKFSVKKTFEMQGSLFTVEQGGPTEEMFEWE